MQEITEVYDSISKKEKFFLHLQSFIYGFALGLTLILYWIKLMSGWW